MRRLTMWALPVLIILLLLVMTLAPNQARSAPQNRQSDNPNGTTVIRPFLGGQGDAPALLSDEDMLPRWRLQPSEQAYAAIDGKHLLQYVNELVAIAYRCRDSGHQFWGRLTGFPSHVEAEQWTLAKFKSIGLSDVHGVPQDLAPQWNPKSWEVTATGNGKRLRLDTAYPGQNSPGTSTDGLDLEVAYAGLGSEADYHGLDVRGKAVVLFSVPLPAVISSSAGAEDALRRAADKGAAAIIEVVLLPGKVRGQIGATKVPTFSMGMEDGYALRDLIGSCSSERPAHLKIRMDVEEVPNLKTDIIFGTLPGMTDEKVFILAHLDSWFEGATDNASGVATMLGLAEYFSKIPKEKRHRTIVFVGSPGHHNGKKFGAEWLKEHPESFGKTVLVINSEHTSAQAAHLYGWKLEKTNVADPENWYMRGSPKFKDIAMKAALEFGVTMYDKPLTSAPGETTPISELVPASLVFIATDPPYFHSDGDDWVPYTQLEAVTRAYAKIITDTDKLSVQDMEPPK